MNKVHVNLLVTKHLKRPKGNNMYHMILSSLHKAQLAYKYESNNRNGKKINLCYNVFAL